MAKIMSSVVARIVRVSHDHSGNGGGNAWSALIALGSYIRQEGGVLSEEEKKVALTAFDSAISSLFRGDRVFIQAFKCGPESLTYRLVSEFLDPRMITKVTDKPDYEGFAFLDPSRSVHTKGVTLF